MFAFCETKVCPSSLAWLEMPCYDRFELDGFPMFLFAIVSLEKTAVENIGENKFLEKSSENIGKTSHREFPSTEASLGMAPAFAILASNDAAAKVASKNSASAGVQLFQPLGKGGSGRDLGTLDDGPI